MLEKLQRFFARGRNVQAQREYPAAAHDPERDFAGRTALIAGSGLIGSAIAAELLARGSAVTVIDRNPQTLEKLASSVSGKVQTVFADLADAGSISALDLPDIDLLVLAAGIQCEANSLSDTEEQWQASLDSNIAGPARLVRKVVPAMVARKAGSIVLVSSIHACLPSRWASYSASKAAQEAMMREWAVDLAPHGIRVNAVAPGWVSGDDRTSRLALLHQRTIPPEYIARSVAFLANDAQSAFTTGSVLTVDAGASLYSGRVPFDLPTSDGHR